jgi:hypothetical protein
MAAKLLLQGSVNPLRTKLSAIIEDYAAVFSGIAEAAQERPYLALFKFSLATAVGAMMMSNPDEEQYEGSLVEASDAIGVLSIHERNKVAANYVRDTLDAYRSGHVRYVNLFVCSVLVRQEYPTKVRGGASKSRGSRCHVRTGQLRLVLGGWPGDRTTGCKLACSFFRSLLWQHITDNSLLTRAAQILQLAVLDTRRAARAPAQLVCGGGLLEAVLGAGKENDRLRRPLL